MRNKTRRLKSAFLAFVVGFSVFSFVYVKESSSLHSMDALYSSESYEEDFEQDVVFPEVQVIKFFVQRAIDLITNSQ